MVLVPLGCDCHPRIGPYAPLAMFLWRRSFRNGRSPSSPPPLLLPPLSLFHPPSAHEAIANAPDAEHPALAGARGELGAQATGVAVERTGGGEALKTPDGAQEVMLCEDARGLVGEVQEQCVLAWTQADGLVVQKDGTRAGVDQ